jgi:DNA-directed RNA polymerase specialized sigma54-like protein
MHNVIMHNSHNAWLADQNHHGTRGDRVHNAYWIMHRSSDQIMHYQHDFLSEDMADTGSITVMHYARSATIMRPIT